MRSQSRRDFILAAAASALAPGAALAQEQRPAPFSPGELVDNGHRFFGTVSRGLAQALEEAVRRFGQQIGRAHV